MKKRIITPIIVAGMLGCMCFSSLPSFTSIPVEVEAQVIDDTVSPCADVVYWIYRTLSSGKIQRRRWNETKGYWVDPHWMDVTVK